MTLFETTLAHHTSMKQILFLSTIFSILLVPCLGQDKSVDDLSLIKTEHCKNITYRKNVFDTVSIEYRENLRGRFEKFLKYKCEEDFGGLVNILAPSCREQNRRDEFIKDMEFYYEGEDKFISFVPTEIGETISPLDNKADIWFIKGCLTEKIRGKTRSVERILEAIRDDDIDGENIFFGGDITTRRNDLGANEKCNPKKGS